MSRQRQRRDAPLNRNRHQQTQDRRHLDPAEPVARRPSPAFKLKIETNLDAEGNYAAVQQVEASGLWNDPVVASKRIPREEVQVHQLIGQGAFGQVFSGSLRGDTVAVKKLRPETQQDDDHVDGFLAEVKVSAALNHPHIVQFVGVAWTSVSDL
ncbi:hypothetical protein PR001_g6962 [Phytophthora rubi]|uniref:Protein kinase domain-containing protein n=1 Tax=Phytophthora rubi TaxID=129364 RepID=A0A6A3NI43_9STRA|nr:hypothetical protein PR001_g6962 [Phytophthora rubi]